RGNDSFFDTITVRVNDADDTLARARDDGINLRRIDANTVGVALDETTTPEIVGRVRVILDASEAPAPDGIPDALRRDGDVLVHPVFRPYHSETQMLRSLRRLADRDLALDRTMIPLGSCTMKLNATTEMAPITWPEFAAMHPFAPVEQAAGYAELFAEL